jgi:hypothetical protein
MISMQRKRRDIGRNVIRIRANHSSGPKIKERRTKAAPGAPAKGHEERTLADAPFGARLKALLLHMKFGGFPGSSVLTLARQFQVVVLSSKRRKDSTIIGELVQIRHKEVRDQFHAARLRFINFFVAPWQNRPALCRTDSHP